MVAKRFGCWKLRTDLQNVDKLAIMSKLRNSSEIRSSERELQELVKQEKSNTMLKTQVALKGQPKSAVEMVMK